MFTCNAHFACTVIVLLMSYILERFSFRFDGSHSSDFRMKEYDMFIPFALQVVRLYPIPIQKFSYTYVT